MEARDFMDLWASWRVYPSSTFTRAPESESEPASDETPREMTEDDVRELRAALGG